jgi:hypothetical protein
MCKLLIEKGIDIAHIDSTNKTAGDHAKKLKFTEIAELLNN